jgi:PAS domain S-box-containing protein
MTVEPGHRIVSKTDAGGRIVSGNEYFFHYSGYKKEELIGRPHNILRHADMPKIVFRLLWTKLRHGMDVNAYVKNRRKDGSHYWVYATVTPSFNKKSGAIEGYFSIRKRANPDAVGTIAPFYRKLGELERSDYEAAKAHLKSILDERGMKFNDLMLRVQSQGF